MPPQHFCHSPLELGSPTADPFISSHSEKRWHFMVKLAKARVNAQARGGRRKERRAGDGQEFSWHRLLQSHC